MSKTEEFQNIRVQSIEDGSSIILLVKEGQKPYGIKMPLSMTRKLHILLGRHIQEFEEARLQEVMLGSPINSMVNLLDDG